MELGAFKDGHQAFMMRNEVGRPSVITDELIQKVDCQVKENRRFMISSLAEKFPLSQEVFFTKLCPNV
ncbi:hypothetical protein TNCV_378001 [Trichonephila clavipes]|nr:hypothetical protein TNCV_378001 [Trichonephila clavipes]